ncbi:MAG TPA: DNA polymerase III subunit delta' [Fimbriiglobus sp.]|nr:DNA polymerase III subunit delta' [Fimbriiglobus sp.]
MAWERIRGHDAARDQLLAAHRRGRLAHAYLFVGAPGVGKRLFAVEFAKAMLCDRPPAPLTACDACPSCTQVAAETHPDFFTVRTPADKHDLPVEEMHEFCGKLALKPARGPRKVGVVEDADDFNESSANCFLKTLEEPPPGSVLILLATSAERQLPTILSRSQVVRFHPLSDAELREVLASYGVNDPDRVGRLVRLASGSPGQALALNDDALWAFRETLLNSVTAAKPDPVGFAAVWTKFVEEVGKESAAQRERASLVLRLLMDVLRSVLRLSVGAGDDIDPTEREKLRRFAERTGPDHLADLLEACAEADYQIDRKVQLVLVTESLVDKLCRPPATV